MNYFKQCCLLFLLLFMIGCGAYFNTYYNAQKLFQEAQDIGFDDQGRPKSTAIPKYNKAIKKCGIILTDYKNSRWADDALFLLARSFYYKGNSFTLAIEKFDDLIKFYPQSEFVPDAMIYTAKSNYRFNNKDLAFEQLQTFINDSVFKEKHPGAMIVLANYYLEEQDLIEANYYFQKIIEKYPRSEEYQEAFFLRGKTYLKAGNYTLSNEVFNSLLDANINRSIKLDARYHIAFNHLILEEYTVSYQIIEELLKDEFRIANIPAIQLLKARCLSQLGDIEQSVELFQKVIDENKNSLIAAEASFFMAETFFAALDYENAISSYSNVKKQNKNSEYVENALSRSSVISEIIQYNNPDNTIPTKDLVNQKLKLAEYYIEVLSLPDSALSIYDKIIADPEILQGKLDTLISIRNSISDSVLIKPEVASADTSFSDSLSQMINDIEITSDSLFDTSDSSDVVSEDIDLTENILIPEGDTVRVVSISELDELVDKIGADIVEYRTDYIPFAQFVKTWIYHTILLDSVKAKETAENMINNSPENPYTKVVLSMLRGEPVELIDQEHKQATTEFESAFDNLDQFPDSALVSLKTIADNESHEYYLKANYTLGYYYYSNYQDTVSAEVYFTRILVQDKDSEFKSAVRNIYDGTNFIRTDRLDFFSNQISESDSLDVLIEIEADTLKHEVIEEENLNDSTALNMPARIIEKYDPPAPPSFDLPEDPIPLEIEILPDGSAGKIIILDPDLILEEEMILLIEANVRRWKFEPAFVNGNKETAIIKDQIKFKIN